MEQTENLAYMTTQARNLVEIRYQQVMAWKALLNEYKRLLNLSRINV